MTTVHRVHNFAAGPAVLPVPVLEEIQRDLLALPGVGMSILEISHRSKTFESILEQAEADVRTLGNIPANYRVLFLQGGASLQFSMVPMNLLPQGATADYIDTGAQKNMGPAGVTVVIVRDDLLPRSQKSLPTMLSYAVHAENKSLYNTPPAFAVYALGLVMKWLIRLGGLEAIAKANVRKAAKLYAEIDRTGFYRGTAKSDSRSLMNVTFRLATEDLEKAFIKESTAAGLDGLKGHRSVGGMRASIYNAFPEEGIDALVSFMREFERKHG